MKNIKWGEYKLIDLFEITTVKSIDKGSIEVKESYDEKFKYQFIGRTAVNNGIQGYVKKLKFEPNEKNVFSIIQIGENITQFRENEWYGSQNLFKLKPLNNRLVDTKLFVIASINRSLSKFSGGYSSYPTLNELKNMTIKLPQENENLNFKFMGDFIAELEAQKIAELEAYLNATGLSDYELTEDEKFVLNEYDNMKFTDFKVVDIFDVSNTKNILSRDIVENSGKIPYLCASAENNSISSYISYKEELKDKGNCVFIGGKTFVVTYQKNDFFSNDSHNLSLHLKNDEYKNKYVQLFLATCIKRSLGYKYSWGDSVSKAKIKSDLIAVPIINDIIVFDKMSLFISAIQKLVIKDVVEYSNKKIKIIKK